MPYVQRSSDVVESYSERALTYGFGGIVSLGISALLLVYRGSSGMFVPLAIILAVIGLAALSYAAYNALAVRKVAAVAITCPYCKGSNRLIETPHTDFTCSECHRLIPILDGRPLAVQQVRCGYCNELNYFSEKTDVLLCESCNHEIPIAHEEGYVSKKKLPSAYAVQDDDRLYELILVAHGHKTEELIATLQHMLALNRNQVKQMLMELPVTLLTGIPRKKAEILKAQLAVNEALADFRPVNQ